MNVADIGIKNYVAVNGVGRGLKDGNTDKVFKLSKVDSEPMNGTLYSDDEITAQRSKNNALNKIKDYDVQSVLRVAPNAPESVKIAWVEASREVGWNGLGMTSEHGGRGILDAQLTCNNHNGVDGMENILGNSIESAMAVIKAAQYQRNNPAPGDWTADMSEWDKEKKFYSAFLDKLEKLRSGELDYGNKTLFDEVRPGGGIFPENVNPIKISDDTSDGIQGKTPFNKVSGVMQDGTEYRMEAYYSENSSAENPIIDVRIVMGDDMYTYPIEINKVDMENASRAEQFALISFADDADNVVHRYPKGSAGQSNAIFTPILSSYLAEYGLQKIPWMDYDLDALFYWERDGRGMRNKLMQDMLK